MIKIKRSG